MKVLITSGGTREAIDDVRYVGNRASGRTGVLIAEEAVRRYHTVFLLSGEGAASPAQWALDSGLIVQRRFVSAADLLAACEEILAAHEVDAIIASAAVADFAPIPVEGKIPSTQRELVVRMVPTPKLIDRLATLAPAAKLVAFKLESGKSEEELLTSARRIMERCGAVAVVANDASGMASPDHGAVILTGAGGRIAVENRARLAVQVLDYVEGPR